MAGCWSCAKDPGDGAFCAACGKIQPARPRSPFDLLGLPRRQHLDDAALESRYRELSRLVHPDKFSRAAPRERRCSLEQSTALNEAFRTLRDPVRRAEFLLKSEGFEVASEAKPGTVRMAPEFLEEMIEEREALSEAKAGGGAAVQALAQKIRGRRDASLSAVDRAFAAWENGGGREALAPAVGELAKLRYYARFLDEVEGRDAGF